MEVLGIDVGGSGIKGAPVNTLTAEVLSDRYRIDTPQPATPHAIANAINHLIQHFNWKGLVGVGFPAVVQHGMVHSAANIDDSWIGIPIDYLLSERSGCKVFAVNDADAAGLAEIHHGAGKGIEGLVMMITVGTGIGTALFNQGVLMPNTELGHLEFKKKTVERYSSDSVRKKADLNWKQWGKRFNESLAYYEKLFNPDLFIVGGGTSKKMDKFEAFVTVKTPMVPAQLLNNAGLIGAAMFASLQE
jgi:polyphosphate glucokinase